MTQNLAFETIDSVQSQLSNSFSKLFNTITSK